LNVVGAPAKAAIFLPNVSAIVDLAFQHNEQWIDHGKFREGNGIAGERFTWFFKSRTADHFDHPHAFNLLMPLVQPILDHVEPGSPLVEAMINYYPSEHTLHWHRDMARDEFLSRVYVVDLMVPGDLDFFCLNGSSEEFMGSVNYNTWPVGHSAHLDPGEMATWTKADEQAGWFHGGVFPAGRMSLVLRFQAPEKPPWQY